MPSPRVWCALPKGLVCPPQGSGVPSPRVWCALPKGLVCPPQGSGVPSPRVWCALPKGLVCLPQGSGVPSPRVWCALPKGLVCPPKGSGVPPTGGCAPSRRGSGKVWCAFHLMRVPGAYTLVHWAIDSLFHVNFSRNAMKI